MAKDVKNMSTTLTTVNTQIKKIEEANSDLSDSQDEDKASHLQMADIDFGKSNFQFAQLDKQF